MQKPLFGRAAAPAVAACLSLCAAAWGAPAPVELKWLGDQAPRTDAGASWGVPFVKGEVSRDQQFQLKDGAGRPLPLQSWPLAQWPDGSLKWVGFATAGAGPSTATLTLSAGTSNAPSAAVQVQDGAQSLTIDTGAVRATIDKRGSSVISSLSIGDKVVARNGRLGVLAQEGATNDVSDNIASVQYASEVEKVTVEQSGPVRAVVRVQGKHKAAAGERRWLPFDVRFYFYAGAAPIRMVHTFVYDGDQQKDVIRGMSIVFDVPFREEIQNRHVRFGGEGAGLWAEPVEPLFPWQRGINYPGGGGVWNAQVAGERIPNKAEVSEGERTTIDVLAKYNDYRLIQPNADGFTVEKRTGTHAPWIAAGAARRASGYVFAGDVSGGLGAGLMNFWQTYPKSLEVRNATKEAAELRIWLWSPEGPEMDLRHYDDHAHGLSETYEDVEMEMATPFGVARTHELTLYPAGSTPAKADSSAQARDAAAPPHLTASPQRLHDARAFGIWSVQDRSTPFKAAVEDQLDAGIAYYQKSIEQWNWFGFWDFGDVMHGYDPARHVWRYDIGGFAWDNSEQATDMWLWYSFLRTGRADIFRMAEAMTRHTGEVDFYHIGPMAGLGSRHNVQHWGDGAKEARISMAPYRRYYYYLTTDERTGDIMTEALQADTAITRYDPMRKADPPVPGDEKFVARIRGGPDFLAFMGNWWTAWERTGDPQYKAKLDNAIASVAALPYWFKTGRNLLWGFEPSTGKVLVRDPEPGGYNLVNNMGGPEVMMELVDHLDDPVWTKIWLQYARLTNGGSAELLKRDQETGAEGADAQFGGGGKLSGYAYWKTKIPAYGDKAVGAITNPYYFAQSRVVEGPDSIKRIEEGPTGLVSNDNNNNALHAIQVLEMAADRLPTERPVQQVRRGGGGGRRGGGRGRRGGANAPTTATTTAQPPASAN